MFKGNCRLFQCFFVIGAKIWPMNWDVSAKQATSSHLVFLYKELLFSDVFIKRKLWSAADRKKSPLGFSGLLCFCLFELLILLRNDFFILSRYFVRVLWSVHWPSLAGICFLVFVHHPFLSTSILPVCLSAYAAFI